MFPRSSCESLLGIELKLEIGVLDGPVVMAVTCWDVAAAIVTELLVVDAN